MNLKDRVEVLAKLGDHLESNSPELQAQVAQAQVQNPWFTKENIYTAIQAICNNFLKKHLLENWLQKYDLPQPNVPLSVGLVLAGNIPLVGFYDLLCVFLAGHKSKIKLSEKDKILIPYLTRKMTETDPGCAAYFEIVDKLDNFDAVIATGSNNSSRYFEAYFGKYPNIIRKNRNAVAVLKGDEPTDRLLALGTDVFQYFGLGCRNVSKLYIPPEFNFDPLLEALHEFREIVLHNKYKNNFDYNYSLNLLNKIPMQATGCIILTENPSIQSRIAELHFEYYSDVADLTEKITAKTDEIQCVVSDAKFEEFTTIPFGKAQTPGLDDHADGIDVMDFLASLPAMENPIRNAH